MVWSPLSGVRSFAGAARLSGALCAVAALATSACNQLTSRNSLADPGNGAGKSLGCVQGVAVDGLTGKTLEFAGLVGTPAPDQAAAAKPSLGVRVLVGDTVLTPSSASLGAADANDLNGHFNICNVPLDETFPLVVDVAGYQKIEGSVRVDSTVASKSSKAHADIQKLVPVQIVNLRLFKLGIQTSDLKFVVSHDAGPVKNAQVILAPLGGSNLSEATASAGARSGMNLDNDGFLIPRNISLVPLTMTTNDQGIATFPAAQLVLGAEMHYRVIPATNDVNQTVTEDNIHIGILTATQTQNPKNGQESPYTVFVDIKNPQPAFDPQWISSSANSGDFNETGELTLEFNREIEIVPGTEDNIVAVLNDANGAELAANVPGNFKPEQVIVTIDANSRNRVHFAPVWKTKPTKQAEGALSITYEGLTLRPISTPGTAGAHLIKGATVSVFGAVNVPQIATTLALPPTSGVDQAGPAGAELPTPIAIKVIDQFGNIYRHGLQLTVTASGSGTVRDPGTSYGSNSTIVSSDSVTGIAKVMWRLGSENGTQALTVSALQIPALVIHGVAQAVPSSVIVTGGGQSGPALATLAQPIQVQVLDQNRQPMNASMSVRFTVRGAGSLGGGTVSSGPQGSVGYYLDVLTDANARASVKWTLGSAGSASGTQQELDVQAGIATATVSATAYQVLAAMINMSGANFPSVPVGTDITLKMQLLDQQSNPYLAHNSLVDFEVTSGTGSLRAPAVTDAGTAQLYQATADSSGIATVVYRVLGGAAASTFSISAKSAGVATALLVSGTVGQSPFAKIALTSSAATAAVNSDVTYTLQLEGAQGDALALAGVKVFARVSGGTATVRGSGALPADGAQYVWGVTGSDGKATVLLRVTGGASASSFELTAEAPEYPSVTAVKLAGTVQ